MKRFFSFLILLSCVIPVLAQNSNANKYEIKSGIMKIATEVMGQVTEATTSFDNYGAMEVTKSKVAVPGQGEMEIASYTINGKAYLVNYTAKQAQEIPVQETVNYLNITDEIAKQYNIKECGTEMIGAKECKKYTEEISQMGQTAKITVWVWKGIPMKSETTIGAMKITATVVELNEDVFLFPQTFIVPQF